MNDRVILGSVVRYLNAAFYGKNTRCLYCLTRCPVRRCFSSESNNPYNVLGISKKSSDEEIKRKFRELAKKYHPDLNPSTEARNKMSEIVSAYEILSDPIKRREFDNKEKQQNIGTENRKFQDMNIENWFTDISWIFPNMEELTNRHSWLNNLIEFEQLIFKNKRNKGKDIFLHTTVDFFEAINGANRMISTNLRCKCQKCNGLGFIKTPKINNCSYCGGTGLKTTMNGPFLIQSFCMSCNGNGYSNWKPCKYCNGKGFEFKSKNIFVKIPEGTKNGQQLKIDGQGHYGVLGVGDAYVKVIVKPHSVFKWIGNDVYIDVPISIESCFFGTKIKVPNLDNGFTEVHIPPKTDPKIPFVLKGKGPPIFGKTNFGNYVINFIPKVPLKNSNREQSQLDKTQNYSIEKPGIFKKYIERWIKNK